MKFLKRNTLSIPMVIFLSFDTILIASVQELVLD
jgi:hypothetical protein